MNDVKKKSLYLQAKTIGHNYMKIKLLFIVLLAQMCSLTVWAKTTYIPTYRSYIHIVNGTDTMSVDGNLSELELAEPSGLFTIHIEHEEVTKDKVKAIKRAKAAAGWAGFAAVMSGVSMAFSSNSLQYYIRSKNEKITTDLAEIYAANSENEQILKIELLIDNNTESELVVNDMERGLTWYILPRQTMNLKVNNPEAANLRISDIHNTFIRYVSAAVGSSVKKSEVDWEDDDCWIIAVYQQNISKHPTPAEAKYTARKPKPDGFLGYRRVSKVDFTESEISEDDYRAYKKAKKQENAKD